MVLHMSRVLVAMSWCNVVLAARVRTLGPKTLHEIKADLMLWGVDLPEDLRKYEMSGGVPLSQDFLTKVHAAIESAKAEGTACPFSAAPVFDTKTGKIDPAMCAVQVNDNQLMFFDCQRVRQWFQTSQGEQFLEKKMVPLQKPPVQPWPECDTPSSIDQAFCTAFQKIGNAPLRVLRDKSLASVVWRAKSVAHGGADVELHFIETLSSTKEWGASLQKKEGAFLVHFKRVRQLTQGEADTLQTECAVARELHRRLPSLRDCLEPPSVEPKDGIAFSVYPFIGAKAGLSAVWKEFSYPEREQAMYQIFMTLEAMLRPPAIAHTAFSSGHGLTVVWNGKHGLGPDGLAVSVVGWGDAHRCEGNGYTACFVSLTEEEAEEEAGPGRWEHGGRGWLQTSMDLSDMLKYWGEAVFGEHGMEFATAGTFLIHSLFDLDEEEAADLSKPGALAINGSASNLWRAASARAVQTFHIGLGADDQFSSLISDLKLKEGVAEFLRGMILIGRLGIRLDPMSDGESLRKILDKQHRMLVELQMSSQYWQALQSSCTV